MQPLPLCAPLRPGVLGGRISTATLGYSSCPKPSFQKQPTRLASTSLSRMTDTKTPFNAPVVLQMCSRPNATPVVAPSVPQITFRTNSTSSSSSSSSAGAGPGDGILNWDSFFKLRATRRRYSVASSAVTSAVTTVLGVQYLSTQDIESFGAQVMGLDPFVVLGMATMACGAAGWLLGPFVGNGVWSLVNRNYTTAFARVGCLLAYLLAMSGAGLVC